MPMRRKNNTCPLFAGSGISTATVLFPVKSIGIILLLFVTFFPITLQLFNPSFVYAAPPTSDSVVGDIVTDPETGADVTVTALLQGTNGYVYAVTTTNDRRIYTTTTVGDIFPDSSGDWTVSTVTTNSLGYVDGFTRTRTVVTDPGPPEVTEDQTETLTVATDYDTSNPVDENGNPINPAGSPGSGEGTVTTPPATATGDINVVYEKKTGASGGDGRDGYGIRVCIPIIGCATVAYSPRPGEAGETPSSLVVDVPNSHGAIESVTSGLSGITALSVGGDGGQGGDAYGNIDAEHGGAAGDGGTVRVTADTSVSTTGNRAKGIFAQSRAGTAGDGGSGYIWSSGGSGGRSAAGGTVRVTNRENGSIRTEGNYAYGIFAQSMGGAAGGGGDSWGIVGAGGSSRIGGEGGNVYVVHQGDITTEGTGSHGIFAQSIGGPGGDGGDAGGLVALGGTGSAGGNGGVVSVTTETGSAIETWGTGSRGILAQSIGGGGGSGGSAGGVVSLGARSSGGGDGANVTVTHNGSIVTHAGGSIGILAQSIGGGGGDAGFGAGLVAIGADGSGGGDGATVTVNTGTDSFVGTSGLFSHGIVAQSIGGGGGTGGTGAGGVAIGGDGGGGGDGGTVNIDTEGGVRTIGDYSRGIYAQSIGGGGGNGGPTGGLVSIGASGDGGGNGGTINAENSGTVSTSGLRSDGFFVQSIGGGGGSGSSSGGAVSLGGSGDTGGDGGTITLTNTGNILTGGDYSRGIFTQSVGGGGGEGGGSGGVVSLGGSGNGGGDGGSVTVTNDAGITTGGIGSDGVYAQSVGGGGGSGGGSGGVVSLGGDSGTASDGGLVRLSNSGAVTTWRNYASALFAQSIGGGGGDGIGGGGSGGVVSLGGTGGAGGDGGSVTLTNTNAALQTTGDSAHAIYAQSVGGGGGSGGGSGGVVSLGSDAATDR